MFATRGELLEKIRLGEDSFLELKEVRFAGGKIRGPDQDNLADRLAAFANTAGGVLLLGVEDTRREVLGIPLDRLDAVETLVRQACEQSIKPALAPIIERLTLPDFAGKEQPVLRVEVARSMFVHQSPGGYLHRVGAAKQPIPPDQLARLFQQRSQSRLIRFDETPVLRADMAELAELLWRRFVPTQSADDDVTLLGKLAMAGQTDDGTWHPTVAGLLMGSERAVKYLPGALVQAVAYRGARIDTDDVAPYQLDAADITGPLDRQITQACAFVARNAFVAAAKLAQGGRADLPAFDALAVFEAITNAVAHRDYSIAGAKIRLRLFADRLEIYSPGMLPNTMTPESLRFRQSARNEALTSLLARCPVDDIGAPNHRSHIMDKRGEGVGIILDRSEKLSGRAPKYELMDNSELRLTIYAADGATSV
ncbi:MAG: transcriptional regulator [Rhodanobacteraceae bacterium]|nr:MAG: transcriptional regulator [Rhodanobacteraceae bacterium]